MDAPSKLKIGPLTYTFKWGDEAWIRATGHMGQCDNDLQVITIHENLRLDQTACTFLHEVAHAVMYAGCWINGEDTYKEENCCDIASYGLVQVWRDNPEAFAWLQGLIKGE
jgi:hypothetical protein